jgi:hypothetical protein
LLPFSPDMNISAAGYSSSIYMPSTATRPAAAGSAPESGKTAANAEATAALSPEELAQLDKLKTRDREVRQHEQAHLSAAGGLAISGASYTYQKGPDGVNYAIGGEVSIDTSPGRTPEETISRARAIRAAALAPADPSGQDRAVAAQASQMEGEARAEIASQSRSESGNQSDARRDSIARYYGASAVNDERGTSTNLSIYA